MLVKDFDRFQNRMDSLEKNIKKAHGETENVTRSTRKITSRFEKIDRVELSDNKDITIQTLSIGDNEERP